jgi:hypothetical protein
MYRLRLYVWFSFFVKDIGMPASAWMFNNVLVVLLATFVSVKTVLLN